MKRIIALLLAALMCIALVACGEKEDSDSKSDSSATSSKEDVDSSSSKDDSSSISDADPTDESKDETSAPDVQDQTLEDYLQTDAGKAILQTIESKLEGNDTLTMDCYAEGNTFVYDAKFKQTFSDDQVEQMKPMFEEQLKEGGTIESQMSSLTSAFKVVGFDNISVRVIYRNGDGTIISEKTFN